MVWMMKVSGMPVQVTNVQRRCTCERDGTHHDEWQITALVSGLTDQRRFLDRLGHQPLHLEVESGDRWSGFDAELLTAVASELQISDPPVWRHVLSLNLPADFDQTIASTTP